jgi:Type IV Pilus-assembly protein W
LPIPRGPGFALLEAVIASLIGLVLLIALLAATDSAARLNKSEIAAAEAQASLRYASNRISAAVRAAGAGGLHVGQSILVRADPQLPGLAGGQGGELDNVVGGSVTNLSGGSVPVRPGTDVLDVRGVLFSSLVGFDDSSGCGACSGVADVIVHAVTTRNHVNDDASNRPRFSEIDAYTQGASGENPMFVVVAAGDDLHAGCPAGGAGRTFPPQRSYAVGALSSPTALGAAASFGPVDFGDSRARELATEDPDAAAPVPAAPIGPIARAGILDDVVFFIDDSDPQHPTLAQGLRRGSRFDVVALADDVEDLQVSYGVDGLYGSDAILPDGSLGRLVAASPRDPDPDVSTQVDGDEWAPNVAGERSFRAVELSAASPPHCPLLRGVFVSLVARSHDPDPSYRGPDSSGIRTMNSPAGTGSTPAPPSHFRRRSHATMISLRNFSLDG